MGVCKRFEEKCRAPLYDLKTGIKTDKKHYLALKVNTSILLYGFGIYGPTTKKELVVEYGIYTDDYCCPGNQKFLIEKIVKPVDFYGGKNIVPMYFGVPLKLRRFRKYILYLDVGGYLTYKGRNGEPTKELERVKFIFSNEFDHMSLSTPTEGNFPKIYYDFPEAELATKPGNLAKSLLQLPKNVGIASMLHT